jgi:phosphoglucosamine mutase
MERKYFGTDGVRGRVGKCPITPSFAMKLGWAAGKVFGKGKHSAQIAIGKDSRKSGDMLESALISGLTSAGIDVISLGVLPTPGIAQYVSAQGLSAGIVISASHNPFYDNGIKFFSHSGEKLSDQVELDLEAFLDKDFEIVDDEHIGSVEHDFDAANEFAEFCISKIDKQKMNKNIKIVVDCANGATSTVAPLVFDKLGLDVTFINSEPNGLNINLNCGAVHLEALIESVKKVSADIGFAYDGDGDRIMAVDAKGNVIDGDQILFLLATEYKDQHRLSGGVVGTLMTNFSIEKAFEQHKISFARANVGDRYVMEILKSKGWLLGGESSGHIICLDSNSTGDGIIASLKILEILSENPKKLAEILASIEKTPQVMINVPLSEKISSGDLKKVEQDVQEVEEKLDNTGRVLLRPSGTEPVLRVMVEAEDEKLADQYCRHLVGVVKSKFN